LDDVFMAFDTVRDRILAPTFRTKVLPAFSGY